MTFRFLVLLAVSVSTVHAQFTYTGASDDFWSNASNWTFGGSVAGSYPETSGDVIVTASGRTVLLTEQILIDNLELGNSSVIDLGTNRLILSDTLSTSGINDILDGSLEAASANLTNGLRLNNVMTEVADTTNANGLLLRNAATYTSTSNYDITSDTGIGIEGSSTGFFINQGGTFKKSAGTGISNVSAPYTQTGPASRLEASTGTLAFKVNGMVDLQDGVVASAAKINFEGPTMVDSINLEISGDGTIVFSDALTLDGTLTSTRTSPGIGEVRSEAILSGGIFNLGSEAPFKMFGGASTAGEVTTNRGSFTWGAGRLFDFVNEASQRGQFVIGEVSGTGFGRSRDLAGHFRNEGFVLGETSSVVLESDAHYEIASGATLELINSTIRSESGATNERMSNAGTIRKTGLPTQTLSNIGSPLTSTGRIEVSGGRLLIQEDSSFSGVLACDRSVASDALFNVIGSSSDVTFGLSNVNFEAAGGGVFEFGLGTFPLSGLIESSGDAGSVRMTSGGADLIVEAGQAATLNFASAVPLQLGSNNNTPEFRIEGELLNQGTMEVLSAGLRVRGSEPLQNEGNLVIDGTLNLGSTSEAGFLTNNGVIDFEGSDRIRFFPGSLLTNRAAGNPSGQARGTVILDSGDSLTTNVLSTSTQFLNQGRFLVPGSGGAAATVNVVFEQSGAGDAIIEVPGGTVLFRDEAILRTGKLQTGANVSFENDVTFGGTGIELVEGGKVTLGFASSSILESNLHATGSGEILLSGGSVAPATGVSGLAIDCAGNTVFEMTGGTLGLASESLSNKGNFVQSNGDVDGNFTNLGDYTFAGGSILGAFANGSEAMLDAGELNLATGLLETGASLINWIQLDQTGTLTCQSNASVTLNRGIHLLDSATISGQSGSSGHRYVLNGGTLRGASSRVSLDEFTFNGGLIETVMGSLRVSPQTLVLDGGSLSCARGTQLTFEADPTGAGLDGIHVDGSITFDIPSSSASASTTLKTGGSLTGSGVLEVDLTQNGTLAPGNSIGTLTLTGALTQSASATTTIEISPSGNDQVVISGEASLGGALVVELIEGVTLSLGQTFTILTAGNVTGTYASLQVTGDSQGFDLAVSYNASSVVLTVVDGGDDYAAWAAGVFNASQLADDAIFGPAANPDDDELPNVFEFIFGTSPLSGGDVFPLDFTFEPDLNNPGQVFPTFTYRATAGRVGYVLEMLDLKDLPTDMDEVVEPTTLTGSTGDVQSMQTTSSTSATRAFYALRARLLPEN